MLIRARRNVPLQKPRTGGPRKDGAVSKLLRGLVAGYGAKKMGCGCFGTIIAFLLLWWLLGNFEIFR